MKTKTFYFSMILVFLFAILTVGCSSTDLNDEISEEENNITNEEIETIDAQSIDVRNIKIPAGG